MILELKHPTRGDIGWVELRNGKVIKAGSAAMINQVRQMQGWTENSVRVYAVANNWIVETKVVQPGKNMQMSKGEDNSTR